MKKVLILLACIGFLSMQVFAQQAVTGVVTSAEDGAALPGVSVSVKGTQVGTITDLDGKYSVNVPDGSDALVISFMGMVTQEVAVSGSVVNVVLVPSDITIDDVVVTALGISREKKSLGYSTQEVKGDAVSTVKSDNFINSLSGKVTGVQVKRNTNMGGSTNIVMRGSKSLTNTNQVLFVVDGVPISNSNFNSAGQNTGGVGYDYGNAASDINPDDIESVNVLKGAAATALYGSRAASGVIMITTKKGSGKSKGVGVSFSSAVTVGSIDKSTFPTYQNKYGAGYGRYYDSNDGYFLLRDINGDGTDDEVVPVTEDASFGAPFDPSRMVYQWNSLDPALPNYQKATPWVAAANGPITFFETPMTYVNNIAIENAFDKGTYRMSYSNYKQNGLMPNSELKKNSFGVNGTYKVTNKLTAIASINYTKQNGTGRNSTGYNDNITSSMRQWMQTNVDFQELKDAYFSTGRNVTWNPSFATNTDLSPIYWDNPYWTRYKNYETDQRNRYIGNVTLDYKIADWVSIMGRVSMDEYSSFIEERRAVGSVATPFGIDRTDQGSGYLRSDIGFAEYNYDFMANFKKNINEDISFTGILGANIRRTFSNRITSSTTGGLVSPEIYSLQNSSGPLPFPVEIASKEGVDGFFGSASFGYKSMVFVDGTYRLDHSSTLPEENSTYGYYSASTSFVFSEVVKQSWLSFGKLNLSYAQVGAPAPFDQLVDIYNVETPFNTSLYSVPRTKKNSTLKPEITGSLEAGLAMNFLMNRFGFDLALYKTNSINQILPLTLSQTSGYQFKYINAGEIENKGVELSLTGAPISTGDLKWVLTLNWTKNQNKVVSLEEGVDNLQLGAFQGGVTVNAKKGEPYGVLKGTDYTYADGQMILSATTGKPVKSKTATEVIGNVTPDWTGGLISNLSYKNWNFSFLIDMQKGGDIFSLDMYYGSSSGLYAETAVNNELGNPVRNPIVYNDPAAGFSSGYAPNTGGYLNQGVNVATDGTVTPNTRRVSATTYAGFGYAAEPNKAFIYDAGYVKLREIAISYTIPAKSLKNAFIKGIIIQAVASNPWIISKNLPYADPESGLGAGNVQGYSVGPMPSTRDFTLNVKLNF